MNQGMIDHIGKKKEYVDWAEKKDATTLRRFWNLLRVDLQTKQVQGIHDYLSTSQRLNDPEGLKNFGKELAEEYFSKEDLNTFEEYRRDLIEICLEQDAAYRLEEISKKNKDRAAMLKEALGLQKIQDSSS